MDPNLKTPYTDEVSLSYQQQLWGESSFRVAYVRKMTRDQFFNVNTARQGSSPSRYTASVNIQGFDTGVSGPASSSCSTSRVG